MSNRFSPPVVARLTLCLLTLSSSAQCTAQDLTGIKCVVNGDRNATESSHIDYKSGRIFLCCEDCLQQFKAHSDRFTTRANHQLVLTGQYNQIKCPISGKEPNGRFTTNVGGTKIEFCCKRCLKKVTDETEMTNRAEMVFGNKTFEKSFSKTEPEVELSEARCVLQPDRQMPADFAAEHGKGRVFCCCQKCADAVIAAPEKHTIAANHQLALTKQCAQTGHPVSGDATVKSQVVELSGVKVKICCSNGVSAVNAADADDAKATLMFFPKTFTKTFKPGSDFQQTTAMLKQ